MGILNLAELKPDMVLASDLKARNGRFLLAKGTRLTTQHLRVLKIWGVVEADIAGAESSEEGLEAAPEIDPAVWKRAETICRERFILTDLDHPVNQKLLRLSILRKAHELSGWRPHGVLQAEPSLPDEANGAGTEEGLSLLDPSQLLKEEVRLSTLPVILAQIIETINKPNSSPKEIANVVSRDTTLSARLLRIVNSAFYGFPHKIDTLSRAVLIVGTKQMSALAMGVKVINIFKSIPCDLIDMKSFLEHSIACGIVARILAGHRSITNTERLFVGGLLHDIGRLVLYNHMPHEARSALLAAKAEKRLLNDLEDEMMPWNHGRIGGSLLKKWRLPVSLETITRYHHAPTVAKDPTEPAIIHVADIIVNSLGIGSSGERLVPPLNQRAWGLLELSVNTLVLAVQQTDSQFQELRRFLL
ncbi:MAG TPA: HDOD domain-containing protein [Syntrophobacteraceae bacterium]|nr:HDOD domain-containing protein [Syntrophobacteraceae bacterium]